MAETTRTIDAYLWAISVIYLFAFASLFVQIPGLYGDNGILPVKFVLQRVPNSLNDLITNQPSLLRVLPLFGIHDVQTGMDGLCFAGIVLSFLGMLFRTFRNAVIYFTLWILYLSLFTVGQTFLWFQWDTLLLEVGFLTAILAPFGFSSIRSRLFGRHDTITFWLVKWLTFRLMFCSGVVKLLSNCPTWWGLTALTYHYESQCIPTPLAWYFHQLPLWFQKFSVVVTYFIEIPLPFLYFSPIRNHRLLAFFGQVLLMVLIILTGNYNFFNWITIVVSLSLVDDDFLWRNKRCKDAAGEKMKRSTVVSRLCRVTKCLANLLVYGVLFFSTIYWFSMRLNLKSFSIDSSIDFSVDDLKAFLRTVVPISIWVGIICIVVEIVSAILKSLLLEPGILRKTTNSLGCVFFGLLSIWMFCVSLVPYTDVERVTQSRLPAPFVQWFRSTSSIQLTHSYGLFRSMTGVGGRPEVVIEGSEYIDRDWKEYNFLFKPGNIGRKPPVVAPHQPRLDWQMWFAALGSYNHNPWFLHLVYRLLTNQTEVVQLIDKGPFDGSPPNYIRAGLYHYHFTPFNGSSKDWWTREYVREYLPIVWKTEQSFVSYLKNAGIYQNPEEPQQEREKSRLRSLMDFLHSLFQPADGYAVCVSLFATGLTLMYLKDAIVGLS